MLLVVAWDGACFDVVDPLVASGRMPALASLIDRGARRTVRSTVPAATFPAWTTFVTAASPARHGLTDFTVREGYGLRLCNASHRRLPPIWRLLSDTGRKAGVYALPATYPPDTFDGALVCGFDTPLGAGRLGARSHPPALAASIERRYGDLAVGGPSQVRIEPGWHEHALSRMLESVALRARIAADLVAENRFAAFLVHFGESDTVAHQFWQFCDEGSPRYAGGGGLRDAIARVYEALDAALALLLDAAHEEPDVMVVSDHGSGGTADRAVLWNRWLADRGFLTFRRGSAASLLWRTARRAGLAAVPRHWHASLLEALPAAAARVEAGARLAGIDWSRTYAFSEELSYFPSIWLNVRGRDPQGALRPEDVDAFVAGLRDALLATRDPFDGGAVVERVRRREEIADGPFAHHVPDLVLELRDPGGYSYAALPSRGGRERRWLRRLRADEATGARGTSMPGAHRSEGMCVLAGPHVRRGAFGEGTLADAGATAMALAGCAPHRDADGAAWTDCVTARAAAPASGSTEIAGEVRPYSLDEEREVSERLRALGYLA